ncbi:MAG: hypothetical protein H7240_13530 [Glaciimonas sp.]|nr:hypothetical protein [Glaciimonas sp.]
MPSITAKNRKNISCNAKDAELQAFYALDIAFLSHYVFHIDNPNRSPQPNP